MIQQTRRQVLGSIGAVAIGTAGCLDQGPPEYDAAEFLEGDEDLEDYMDEKIIVKGDVERTNEQVQVLLDYAEDGTAELELLRMYASGTMHEPGADFLPLVDLHPKYTFPREEGVELPVHVAEYLPDDDAEPEPVLAYYPSE